MKDFFKNRTSKKYLNICLLLLCWEVIFSRQIIEEPLGTSSISSGWETKAEGIFLASQAYFNNWASGGVSNFSGALFGRIVTTKKNKTDLIQGRFRINLGFSYQEDASSYLQKTEDLIRGDLIYGLKLNREHYYGVVRFGIQTQLAKGYSYNDGNKTLISSFFSPGYINTGFGILFIKNTLNLSVYPMNNKNTLIANRGIKKSKYGLKNNNGFLSQTGFAILLNHEAPLMKNIYVQSMLDLFFDYSQFSALDINLAVFIDMRINHLLSAKIITGLIYDNDIIISNNQNHLQFKNLFGLGLSYKLDSNNMASHFN